MARTFRLGFALILLTWLTRLDAATIQWRDWSPAVFKQAKKEKKLVILDLEAIWCHWCHVMDKTTYQDPEVVRLLGASYVAIKVDQDSRPDLSLRYRDWGWPATIIFDGDGKELAKLSGYLPPERMRNILKNYRDDPTPGPSVTRGARPTAVVGESKLKDDLRTKMEERFESYFDKAQGGWGTGHKFLNYLAVEYAMVRNVHPELSREMARKTFNGEMNLLDPVWGGLYQYSTGGRWDEPHFEKIMRTQAENLRMFAYAYRSFKDERYLKTAEAVAGYLNMFLTSPDGAFYTSQDADLVQGQHSADYFKKSDAERRKLGLPRIDKNIYARENGWASNAFAWLYAFTGDGRHLERARKAVAWIEKHRSLDKGGFGHGEAKEDRLYLGDNLAMAQVYLTLAMATGERAWLAKAKDSGDFIAKHFRAADAGFMTTEDVALPSLAPYFHVDENVVAARFFNLLGYYTREAKYKELGLHAMKRLALPEVADKPVTGDILLADFELGRAPVHITVVGPRKDAGAEELYRASAAYPTQYKLVEWYDPAEGPIPGSEIQYPKTPKPAAFACTATRCSLPAFKAEDIAKRIEQISGVRS